MTSTLPARWSQLLDDPAVEVVEILGHDQVHLFYDDGRVAAAAPAAGSDAELTAQLRLLAYLADPPRTFSSTEPELTLSWPGGLHLHAVASDVTDRPSVVIRRGPAAAQPEVARPRSTAGTLDRLVGWGTLTGPAAGLLAAAVRAGETVLVSGADRAGKTTLLWALAMTTEPWRTAVLDDEGELDLPHWQRTVLGLRERAVTLTQLADLLLRFDIRSLVLGKLTPARAGVAADLLDHDLQLLTTIAADSWQLAHQRIWALLDDTDAARRLGGLDRLTAGRRLLLVHLALPGYRVDRVVELPTRFDLADGPAGPAVLYETGPGLRPGGMSDGLRRRLLDHGGWQP